MQVDFGVVGQAALDTRGETITWRRNIDSVDTEITAAPIETPTPESKQRGAIVRYYLRGASLAQEPVTKDRIIVGGVNYLVEAVDADIAGGYRVQARKVSS